MEIYHNSLIFRKTNQPPSARNLWFTHPLTEFQAAFRELADAVAGSARITSKPEVT